MSSRLLDERQMALPSICAGNWSGVLKMMAKNTGARHVLAADNACGPLCNKKPKAVWLLVT